MATHALSQDLSGWSDKTVCRLASSQQGAPQYLQEAKNRGLSCGSGVAKPQSSTTANNSSAMFSQDFENGNQRDIQVDDNTKNKWHIKQDKDGNSIYCNESTNDWSDFNLGSKDGYDYSISYKIKLSTKKPGTLETHIRKDSGGGAQYRAINKIQGRAAIEFAHPDERVNQGIASGARATIGDKWSDIQLIASGNSIEYLVNGKVVASTNDDRVKKGAAMIAVSANLEVCIDNIVVKKATPKVESSQ